MSASDLRARDRAVFWHPCGQMRDYDDFPPLEVVSAAGSRLRLADGREILDAISSWWCKALGHGHPRLAAALRAQLEAFEHVITANTTNAPLVRLCERLLAAANGASEAAWGPDAPPGRVAGHFGKVFLADNGSTAVEIALKMALQAQAQRGQGVRTRFAALAGGYHGETVGALSVGDCALYGAPYRALLFPVTKLAGLPYRAGPEDAHWLDAGAEWPALERALDAEAGTLAAVVYEPVLQAAGQMRLYSPDLLRRLRHWADARGVYLIADEIAAGMGRLGAMLASHLAEGADRVSRAALPDFATLSKGLTGGVLPLSAVLTTDAVAALFEADWAEGRAFLHSNTYTGNALGVAVANAVLDVFASEDILGRVASDGPALRAALRELVARRPDLPLVGARGCGMMAAVDLRGTGGAPLDPARRTGYRVYREAVRRGVLLRPIGDTMYLFPPLTVERADVRTMVTVLEESVSAVAAA
ncbi:MAG TPA: aminotransferase class III-fold pyridoxal phosphate-dependent enzyme [Polyangia bacterium]|nr:aminotransferase class III-fold pyridoxal phosphate-dependent enzyme [Polyangia bacterium]